MSERKLSKEQKEKFHKLQQDWMREVDQCFEAHKDDEINPNRLDGPQTWELAKIQQKYKKRINEELGMDFYRDVGEEKKEGHKKFSQMIVSNPDGFPALPKE
ncbi:MAG: hypothetical protein NC409_12490 [Clostridium sp.]|nr:hypothetical protein [Clostridium sp.]